MLRLDVAVGVAHRRADGDAAAVGRADAGVGRARRARRTPRATRSSPARSTGSGGRFAGARARSSRTRRAPAACPAFGAPLLCPSVLPGVELEPLGDVAGLPAFAAPRDEPWIYDGRAVLRARPRSGRRPT